MAGLTGKQQQQHTQKITTWSAGNILYLELTDGNSINSCIGDKFYFDSTLGNLCILRDVKYTSIDPFLFETHSCTCEHTNTHSLSYTHYTQKP